MKPSLLIDAVTLLSPITGIGRYTYEISKEVQKYEELNVKYFYGYHSKHLIEPWQNTTYKNIKSILVKYPKLKQLARESLMFTNRLFSKKYDIYWQPNFIPNTTVKTGKIITSIHDFSFEIYKDFHPKERIDFFNKYFYKNVRLSDKIITGSEYTKREILERFDFNSRDIKVIYHGIRHDVFKKYDNLEVDFDLPRKFILSVGSIEPRKNLLGLLKAYNLLDENVKKEYKLVLIGFKGWNNSELMEIIEANKDNILYLGFISDEDLAKVYNLASCFVFPSFYEGFGLPPIEAMACGTPVLCSDNSSLPEVCSDAAIYCNPNSIEDISKKITIILSDKELQNNLIKKGLERCLEFTWEKSARKHIEVFKELL